MKSGNSPTTLGLCNKQNQRQGIISSVEDRALSRQMAQILVAAETKGGGSLNKARIPKSLVAAGAIVRQGG